MKTITQYSDQELVLLFNNDEPLYREYQRAIRLGNFQSIKELCDETFIYNASQMDALSADFEQEVEEYNKE